MRFYCAAMLLRTYGLISVRYSPLYNVTRAPLYSRFFSPTTSHEVSPTKERERESPRYEEGFCFLFFCWLSLFLPPPLRPSSPQLLVQVAAGQRVQSCVLTRRAPLSMGINWYVKKKKKSVRLSEQRERAKGGGDVAEAAIFLYESCA